MLQQALLSCFSRTHSTQVLVAYTSTTHHSIYLRKVRIKTVWQWRMSLVILNSFHGNMHTGMPDSGLELLPLDSGDGGGGDLLLLHPLPPALVQQAPVRRLCLHTSGHDVGRP